MISKLHPLGKTDINSYHIWKLRLKIVGENDIRLSGEESRKKSKFFWMNRKPTLREKPLTFKRINLCLLNMIPWDRGIVNSFLNHFIWRNDRVNLKLFSFSLSLRVKLPKSKACENRHTNKHGDQKQYHFCLVSPYEQSISDLFIIPKLKKKTIPKTKIFSLDFWSWSSREKWYRMLYRVIVLSTICWRLLYPQM